MDHPKQIIPIIPGWFCHNFHTGFIPNERILIELIRPGTDSRSATTQLLNESEIDTIVDKDSQLILKSWSNYQVVKMLTPLSITGDSQNIDEQVNLIISICLKTNSDWREPLYHLALIRYIEGVIPSELRPNNKKIRDHFVQLDNNFRQFSWDGFKDMEQDSEVLRNQHIHSLELEKRFPDYKLANEYLDSFYQTAFDKKDKDNEVSAFLEHCTNKVINFAKIRRNSYLQPKQAIDQDTILISRKCTNCPNWFSKNSYLKSGKLSPRCGPDCDRDWDKKRKRKPGSDWVKASQKRKRCSSLKCGGEYRLVNSDGICEPCFIESNSQQTREPISRSKRSKNS